MGHCRLQTLGSSSGMESWQETARKRGEQILNGTRERVQRQAVVTAKVSPFFVALMGAAVSSTVHEYINTRMQKSVFPSVVRLVLKGNYLFQVIKREDIF